MTRFVEEQVLNFSYFNCCGDEDLYPFGCPDCGKLMVFCYECDTLYADLLNPLRSDLPVNSFNPSEPIFQCPSCQYAFPYSFMRSGSHRVTFNQWRDAGLGHLLVAASDSPPR
jgi:hypothetical protein